MRASWNRCDVSGCGHQRAAPHKVAGIALRMWTCARLTLNVDVPPAESLVKGLHHIAGQRALLHMFDATLHDIRHDALVANGMKMNLHAHLRLILPGVHAIKMPLLSEHVNQKTVDGVDGVPHL